MIECSQRTHGNITGTQVSAAPGEFYCGLEKTDYSLTKFSSGSAEFLFLMVLKMHLAKVVIAVIAMPT
jgi:hypothetical protein